MASQHPTKILSLNLKRTRKCSRSEVWNYARGDVDDDRCLILDYESLLAWIVKWTSTTTYLAPRSKESNHNYAITFTSNDMFVLLQRFHHHHIFWHLGIGSFINRLLSSTPDHVSHAVFKWLGLVFYQGGCTYFHHNSWRPGRCRKIPRTSDVYSRILHRRSKGNRSGCHRHHGYCDMKELGEGPPTRIFLHIHFVAIFFLMEFKTRRGSVRNSAVFFLFWVYFVLYHNLRFIISTCGLTTWFGVTKRKWTVTELFPTKATTTPQLPTSCEWPVSTDWVLNLNWNSGAHVRRNYVIGVCTIPEYSSYSVGLSTI